MSHRHSLLDNYTCLFTLLPSFCYFQLVFFVRSGITCIPSPICVTPYIAIPDNNPRGKQYLVPSHNTSNIPSIHPSNNLSKIPSMVPTY